MGIKNFEQAEEMMKSIHEFLNSLTKEDINLENSLENTKELLQFFNENKYRDIEKLNVFGDKYRKVLSLNDKEYLLHYCDAQENAERGEFKWHNFILEALDDKNNYYVAQICENIGDEPRFSIEHFKDGWGEWVELNEIFNEEDTKVLEQALIDLSDAEILGENKKRYIDLTNFQGEELSINNKNFKLDYEGFDKIDDTLIMHFHLFNKDMINSEHYSFKISEDKFDYAVLCNRSFEDIGHWEQLEDVFIGDVSRFKECMVEIGNKELFKQDVHYLQFFPNYLKTYDYLFDCVKQNVFALEYVPKDFMTNELVDYVLYKNEFLPLDTAFPKDKLTVDLCINSIKLIGPEQIYAVPDNLKNEVLIQVIDELPVSILSHIGIEQENIFPVLGTSEVFEPIKKSKLSIKQIKFVDTILSLNEVQNKWDVSDKQDESIMAWLDGDTLKISGNGVVLANEDCGGLFYGFENVVKFSFNDLFDTNKLQDAYGMFEGCEKLTNIDVSKWNTERLKDASWMFSRCKNLKNVDLLDWNTENLRNVSGMFAGCVNIEKVDVSAWNTQCLIYAERMFVGCENLKNIDVSKWNTQSLVNALDMFWGCQSLECLDVSKWNTQNLQYVMGMFKACGALKNVNISNWDTENLVYCVEMFKDCHSLKQIDLANWNTQNLKDANGMFCGCEKLKKVITDDERIIKEIKDKSIIQASKDCFVSDKMKLMQKGISIKPSQDKNSTTKEQTRSKNNKDISR